MLKNIQKYLLLNHPLIWNIRLIPVLLGALLGNILLFLLGYSFENLDFNNSYRYDGGNHFLMYFFIIIVVVLFFILWLVNYSKNNAIKSFYPTRASKLYLEWILILVSIFSIVLFPFSFNRGTNYKLRSYASINEINHIEKILNRVAILMPSNGTKMDYFQEKPTQESSYYNRYAAKNPNDDSRYDYYDNKIDSIFENGQQVYYPDYPNFTQFSLLNYSNEYDINFINFPRDDNEYPKDYEIVKQWLIEAKTDSIKYLMTEYLELEAKNHFQSKITVDEWFSKIYNPPTFILRDSSLFDMQDYYYASYDGYDSFFYHKIKAGYQQIGDAYSDSNNGQPFFSVLLYLSLGVSMLVFSFRVTSGKAWLISMISIGLIALVFWFLTAFLDIMHTIGGDSIGLFPFYNLLALVLFIVELFIIVNRRDKGKSDVLLNHVIGLLPIVPLLVLSVAVNMSEKIEDYVYDNNYYISYINLALTLVTMFFLIKTVVIRWKGLPED